MAKPAPKECVDPKPLLKLSGHTAHVECEAGEPPGPTDFSIQCAAPFPREITLRFSTGDNKLGAFPITFPPDNHTLMEQGSEMSHVNLTSEIELAGSDSDWSLTFVLNSLMAARYLAEVGPFGIWPNKDYPWTAAESLQAGEWGVEVYDLKEVKYGQTIIARTTKTYEGWFAPITNPGLGPPYPLVVGSKVCEDTLEYESEFIHVFTGHLNVSCNVVTREAVPYMPPSALTNSFSYGVASGFVTKKIGNPSKFTTDTGSSGQYYNGFILGNEVSVWPGHALCLGVLPSFAYMDLVKQEFDLFRPNQFYNGSPPVFYPSPPAFYPAYPESMTAYNYMGWPKYGAASGHFTVDKNGDVTGAGSAIYNITATNGIPLWGQNQNRQLPPIVNPVSLSVEVTM